MEATGEAAGLLHKIRPPNLEDAGLEDCALPPESIKEAFLRAATAVRSRIFSDSDDESDANCVNDPWTGLGDSADTMVRLSAGDAYPPDACAAKKGGELPEPAGDKVVDGLEETTADKVVELGETSVGEKPCIDDGLEGLEIGDKGKTGSKIKEEDEDGERLILAEVGI